MALRLALVALLVVAAGGCSLVQSARRQLEPPFPGRVGARAPDSLSDEEIDRRVAFISERLDAGRLHAALWEYGWITVNGGGAIAGAARAATTDDEHKRVFYIIQSVKGAVGIAYLLADPLPGIHGGEPIRTLPAQTHAEKVEQLAHAEALLWKTAQRARQRTHWLPHVGNLLFNSVGGAVMLALHEPKLAAFSAGIGSVVGETELLTAPWEPVHDWDDYERFVASDGIALAPTPRWRVLSGAGAIVVRLEF